MVNITKEPDVENIDINYILGKSNKALQILAGKKLLLTGAGGFLGYYFIKSILSWNDNNPKKQIQLTALSTFRDGIPEWLNLLKDRKDLVILKKDITKYTLPTNLIFDYIIHAASFASPSVFRQYPVETINANVLGLYKILEYMIERKKKSSQFQVYYFFHQAKYTEIQQRETFQLRKHIAETYLVLVLELATMNRRDFAKRYV